MLGLTRALDKLASNKLRRLNICIVVLEESKGKLDKYKFVNLDVKTIPLEKTQFHELLVQDRLPLMDLSVGRGVYLFPDFVTWPLERSKSITTIHDLSFEEVPQFVDDGNAKFLREAVRKSSQRADRIATVTNTMKRAIARFYGLHDNKIIVTNNAVDTKLFYRRDRAEINAVKRKYGIDGEYILCVGNIEPRKNQERLMEAFLKLPARLAKNYNVVLVGAGGWKNEAVYRLAKKQPAGASKFIIIEGKVVDEDMPAIYSGASLSVNPSFYEGFGMPTVEAMACRVLVVASDIPVMREVAGQGAIYVDPNSVESIARGIEQGLTLQPREKATTLKANYKRAASYRWAATAKEIIRAARRLDFAMKKELLVQRLHKPAKSSGN